MNLYIVTSLLPMELFKSYFLTVPMRNIFHLEVFYETNHTHRRRDRRACHSKYRFDSPASGDRL